MPGDSPAEADLYDAKATGHEGISPDGRCEKRCAAEQHQAQTHHRHNTHGKRPAPNNGSPVQQNPTARQGGEKPPPIKTLAQKTPPPNPPSKPNNQLPP